jgi:hypothetical protein
MKENKKQHYSRLIAKSHSKTKPTWNIVKRETGKIHLIDEMQSLLTKTEKIKDIGTFANAFNNFSNNYCMLKFSSSGYRRWYFVFKIYISHRIFWYYNHSNH